jgi:BirA family transcriptional regulator, biotin operon repressor / biotin---[acetyl-CoA-carboxylase] ligase
MRGFDQARLEQVRLPWGAEIRYLRKTSSTNQVALEWAGGGAPEGSLIVTDHQTRGRGRLDRGWFDPPGSCLLFSLILRPRLGAPDRPLISLAAGVALCRTLGDLGLSARLKWPNDVQIGPAKVAGILSEGRGSAVILGVGLNVNVEGFPGDLGGLATSLAIEAGRSFDRLEILESFLKAFKPVYSSLPDGLPDAYRPWCQTLGRWVSVEVPGRTVRGRALDVDRWGGLILEGGEVLRSGDVVHLRQAEDPVTKRAP